MSRESYEALRYSTVEHALRTRKQCQSLMQEAKYTYGEIWGDWEMGEIYRVAKDPSTARHYYEQARPGFERLGEKNGLAFYHRGLGDLALDAGDFALAREHFRQGLDLIQQVRHRWAGAYLLNGLGRAELGLRQQQTAHKHFLAALREAQSTGDPGILLVVLAGLVDWYAAHGDLQQAVSLAALVAGHPVSWLETKARVAMVLESAASTLSAEEFAAIKERSKSLDAWQVAERLVA